MVQSPAYFDSRLAGEVSRARAIAGVGFPLGLGFHVFATATFLYLGAMPLVYFNIFSVLAFSLAIYLIIWKDRLKFAYVLAAFFEMPLHAALATLTFGLESLFLIWLFIPALIVFWLPFTWHARIVFSVATALFLVLIAVLGAVTAPWHQIPLGWMTFFVIFNALGAISTLGVLFALNHRITTKAEAALEKEYARSESLLYNLLPEDIAARLKVEPDQTIADSLPKVAILFADIVDFTPRAATLLPEEVVGFLNKIFRAFDELAEKHGLEKIKTIGDAYMVAAGMPNPCGDPVHRVAEMALDMQQTVEKMDPEFPEGLQVRIGLHAGPAVAGVIGNRKLFYDVWGETVNTASRMESHGEPGRIQVTTAAKEELEDAYEFEPRGAVEVKGIGAVETWWLAGAKA